MRNRTLWIWCVLLAVAWMGFASSPAAAQRVLSSLGEWRPATEPPALPWESLVGNVYDILKQEYYWDTYGVAQLGVQATTARGGFRLSLSREQDFTLAEPAILAAPMCLTGDITFSRAQGNAMGSIGLSCEIYDLAGGYVRGCGSYGISGFAKDGNLSVTNQWAIAPTYLYAPVAAGTYKLRTCLEAYAACEPWASLDQVITVDFCPGPGGPWTATGGAVSLAAYPAGLGSSRQAVRAPEARRMFGVDGTGIQVGLVETGQPYDNLPALAGRLSVLPPATGDPGDYRSDHALATAGIIAGADANEDKAGIAPGASILSAPTGPDPGGFDLAVNALLAASPGLKVISCSAFYGEDSARVISGIVNDYPNLTFVKSAGNGGTPGSVTPPGLSPNVITVGALNRDFTRRADFSSFGRTDETPMKPDLVAPGEYIMAPASAGGFLPFFLGQDFQGILTQTYGQSPTTGEVRGTSFAAPHVAGAAALLYQYQATHPNHDADHRVIKAVLLNSASTNVTTLDGYAWSQAAVGSLPGLTIVRSLDEELGAGALDVVQALRQYQPHEVLTSDTNASRDFTIDAKTMPVFWDLETVSANGMVNYLLGARGSLPLRATLTWDEDGRGGTGLMPLELRLYREGNGENLEGYDLANPTADLLVAATENVGENVKLFDLILPGPDLEGTPDYYLQVTNSGAGEAMFGIAVMPEPATLSLLALGGLAVLMRKRR